MLRNPVVCYSITTELKPKCPTCTQLMSFLALRKKPWERSVLNHNVLSIGNHEKNALLCLLQGIARVKFYCFARQVCREISQATSSLLFRPRETRSSTRFSITAPRSSMHASFEDRGSSRGSRLERDCQLTFQRYCILTSF